MAFPIPEHLPRSGLQDISTQILTKVASTSSKTLTAEVASSWVSELDGAISHTKNRIHERIQADLPTFEQQLSSSISLQERLRTLTENVNALDDVVSNHETGLVPSLLRALTAHAALAQKEQDARVLSECLNCLSRYRREFERLDRQAREGQLAAAVEASRQLESDMQSSPGVLTRSDALTHFKSQFRAVKDRVEEQLTDAYSQAISVTARDVIIRPTVSVKQTSATIDLHIILASLSQTSLSDHLNALRRDLSTHYVDNVLTQPLSLAHSFAKNAIGNAEQTLSFFPAPPNEEDRLTRLENLSAVLNFLNEHLFPAIPEAHASSFKRSLCKPITQGLLNLFLIPLLPSRLDALPEYLEMAKQSTEIEERHIIGTLGQDSRDREVQAWVARVSVHYERKRSSELLKQARSIISREDDGGRTKVEADETIDVTIPVAETAQTPEACESSAKEGEDSWGFNEEGEQADDWGFDDESVDAELEAGPSTPPAGPATTTSSQANGSEEESTDSWDWDDDQATNATTERTDDNAAWDDDPWGESDPEPAPAPKPTPKPATRLEKLATKGKAKHTPQPSTDSVVTHPPPPTPIRTNATQLVQAQKITVPIKSRDTLVTSNGLKRTETVVKEVYSITGRASELVRSVSDALRESAEFARTTTFGTSSDERGVLLLKAAVGMLDLYRALYPVRFHDALCTSAEKPMLFANDCTYIGAWAKRQGSGGSDVLGELAHAMESLGDFWFDKAIETQEQSIVATLADLEGFVKTYNQDRFDECEAALMRLLGQIRDVARRWKGILTKSRYFVAIGALVDIALVRMLDDITALPDITEVESHRLSELCNILRALEGLFLDDPEQPSLVVAYVPSWLKFSYLSELLEASLADINYLFDEGALVDFEVTELTKLVKALFAETSQRHTLIQKLLSGHPDSA